MPYTEIYPHTNGTDTLYAEPKTSGAWSATGIVTGSDTEQDGLYVFANLADGVSYWVRVQAGGSPAETDEIVGWIDPAVASQASVDEISGIVDAILEDTNELRANQGNWLTATGFSTHSASDVWSHGTRTLTSFGSLVSDVATAVWGAGTRTLTAISDSAGVTTLLQRILGIIRTATDDVTAETAQTTAIRNGLATAQNVTDAAQSVIDHGDGDGDWGAVGSGGSGGTVGPGAIEHPITVTKHGQPVDGAAVWVSTDQAGENVIAGTLYTNIHGVTPAFMLDAGTYYAWVQKAKVNFPNPTEFEVS
jgi:hypothetical protein